MRLQIGSRVLIEGDHPRAGEVGVIEGCYTFKHGLGDAVKIDFDDGDGCFVFAKDRGKVTLHEVKVGRKP